MGIQMIKRIMVRTAEGLRKIIGVMEIPADAAFQQHFDNVEFAGRVGSIDFVKEAAKYVLYKETQNGI